jgi:hypothetical protein
VVDKAASVVAAILKLAVLPTPAEAEAAQEMKAHQVQADRVWLFFQCPQPITAVRLQELTQLPQVAPIPLLNSLLVMAVTQHKEYHGNQSSKNTIRQHEFYS